MQRAVEREGNAGNVVIVKGWHDSTRYAQGDFSDSANMYTNEKREKYYAEVNHA